MIISDTHRLAFIHIPKCAGTTVKRRLQPLDDTGGCYTDRVDDHPVLGRIDYVHLPLAVLREHFPDDYRKVRDYRSVAVIRDPLQRFPSSLAQRLRWYKGKPIERLGRREIRRELDRVIDFLSRHRDSKPLPPDYVHFQRQCDYVFDRGEQVVQGLYSTERLDALYRDLADILGPAPAASVDGAPLNRTVAYRNDALRLFAGPLRPLWRRLIAPWFSPDIRRRVRRAVYASSLPAVDEVFDSAFVRDFASSYYAADFALFQRYGTPR